MSSNNKGKNVQSLTLLYCPTGCIVRISKTGTIPSGNLQPWIKPSACWAYGGRNLFRASWDTAPSGESRYLVAEVGGNDHSKSAEDVHIVDSGDNLGW